MSKRSPSRSKSPAAVGYKRPPRTTQFKPGKSGNPRGRPKGSKNLRGVIQKELATRLDVTENGTRKRISKERAIAKQVVNKALTGDPKMLPLLIKMAGERDDVGPSENAPTEVFDQAEDHRVIENLVKRIRLMELPPESPSPASTEPSDLAQPAQPEPNE